MKVGDCRGVFDPQIGNFFFRGRLTESDNQLVTDSGRLLGYATWKYTQILMVSEGIVFAEQFV